jgi:demethylsterigmatocystin 6-O-methyltransferase
MPKFLAETKYQLPVDNAHTTYQMANNTDLPAFVHAMKTSSPEKLQRFGLWMQANKASLPQWLDTIPFEKLCANDDPEKPIFVDVGGSIGHQSVAVKTKYPALPGRIIYQDLPPVIAHGLQVPGVESMVYDFFQEQPIKGDFYQNP